VEKIIINTDMALGSAHADIDDAVAILFALARKELDALAICSTGGNVDCLKASRNIDALLKRLGKDIKHSYSSSKPLDPYFWVKERWTDYDASKIDCELSSSFPSSVELIKECLVGNDDVSIVSIGPMTNIALVLRLYPYLEKRIKALYIMGGSFATPGVKNGCTEFNVKVDPESAKVVCDSSIPKYFFPLDITKKRFVTPNMLKPWGERGEFLKYLQGEAVKFMGYRSKRDGYDHPYSFFHDVMPLVYMVRPELFSLKGCSVDVDLIGENTRGATLFSFSGTGSYVSLDAKCDEIIDFVIDEIREHYGELK